MTSLRDRHIRFLPYGYAPPLRVAHNPAEKGKGIRRNKAGIRQSNVIIDFYSGDEMKEGEYATAICGLTANTPNRYARRYKLRT